MRRRQLPVQLLATAASHPWALASPGILPSEPRLNLYRHLALSKDDQP